MLQKRSTAVVFVMTYLLLPARRGFKKCIAIWVCKEESVVAGAVKTALLCESFHVSVANEHTCRSFATVAEFRCRTAKILYKVVVIKLVYNSFRH